MWFTEEKRFDAKWRPAVYHYYPPDRTADGRKVEYRVRTEIALEHRGLPFRSLCEIYGYKESQ